jgi:hypothetical protein
MGGFPVCWNAILCGSSRSLHLFSMFRFDLFSTRFALLGPARSTSEGLQLGHGFLCRGRAAGRSLIGRG